MHTLDELISKQILNPDKDQISPSHEMSAILHLRHKLDGLSDGLSVFLERNFVFNAAGILLLENTSRVIFRDPLGLKALFETKTAALEAGLNLHKLLFNKKMKSAIALGWGSIIDLPNQEWIGSDCLKAKRLGELSTPTELTMTRAFAANLTPPEGIGIFEATRDQAAKVGEPYWLIRDYR